MLYYLLSLITCSDPNVCVFADIFLFRIMQIMRRDLPCIRLLLLICWKLTDIDQNHRKRYWNIIFAMYNYTNLLCQPVKNKKGKLYPHGIELAVMLKLTTRFATASNASHSFYFIDERLDSFSLTCLCMQLRLPIAAASSLCSFISSLRSFSLILT